MKYLYRNKHWPVNKEYNFNKLLFLLIDRPDEMNVFGYQYWLNKKEQVYRNYDLPAVVLHINNNEICLSWYDNNKINKKHRENNKPAVINSDGDKEYWLNGNFIKKEELK